MKVRIGIDVGGTFTDAAIIDNDTYELIGTEKILTTHSAPTGVAAGIIEVLQKVMKKHNINPEDVAFIAHGTTQATNALLEGDVVKVGIVTLGTGLEGVKARADTVMGSIMLTSSKGLPTANRYLESRTGDSDSLIRKAIGELKGEGCEAIVAAEAFSVDHSEN
jgi:N-methylhydantoinase A/oxoprolinase/acetone carboxylase beta subunit